jgi:signal transduction histidine kinase
MVVVDDEMRYLGVVSPGIVLGHLCKELRVDQPGSRLLPRSAGPIPEATPKPWLLEISHALKNPMTSLLGLSTLLLDARVGDLNARQTRYATLIQQVVRKLISLLNQLLDWTRLDTGQLTFDSEVIPLQPFAQGVIESYWTQLSPTQAQADWSQNFSLDLPSETAVLKADPMRLQLSLHWVGES